MMTKAPAFWREMQNDDLDSVICVADAVHPDLPEDRAVFASRLRHYPQGCLVLDFGDGSIVGYAMSHPIMAQNPPKLDTLLDPIPAQARQFYIHDVAILEKMRGTGLARVGINTLLQLAQDYDSAALISVYGTTGFWEKFGFQPSPEVGPDKLSAYGDSAVYMVR